MRIDKFLWSVRLFKTRTTATHACNKEKILVNENFCKPSRPVKPGEEISVKFNPVWRTFKILSLPKSRVAAKMVPEFMVETTPAADLERLAQVNLMHAESRKSGLKGRPTKKNRRDLDKFN